MTSSEQSVSPQRQRQDDGHTRVGPHPLEPRWQHHMTEEWPPRGVKAVADVLCAWYRSEYETTAPVTDWYPSAFEVVNAYREAEGWEPLQ